MKDSYTVLLQKINNTPREEIRSLSRNTYQELLEHAGERYRIDFKSDDGPIEKGGQGIVIKCTDHFTNDKVVVKFALPDLLQKDSFWRRKKLKEKFSKFVKEKKTPFVSNLETECSARFIIGCLIQKQLNEIIFKKGLAEYGYVPKIIEMGKTPKLWVSMEYLPYEPLLKWCQNHKHEEILYLFYRMITFLENVVHRHGIAHCDLKPNNWMVANQLPVLYDFLISKNLSEKDSITDDFSAGHGSEYSSTRQKRYFKHRDYQDDFFTVMLTFWVMWNRIEPEIISTEEEIPIHTIFPPEAVPEYLRQIFLRATNEGDGKNAYKEISEIRLDVERVLEWLLKEKAPISTVTTIEHTVQKLILDWEFIEEHAKGLQFGDSVKWILRGIEKIME
jgi:serine/threonine protein kinase